MSTPFDRSPRHFESVQNSYHIGACPLVVQVCDAHGKYTVSGVTFYVVRYCARLCCVCGKAGPVPMEIALALA